MEQAAPRASASRRGRDTLVPSGFECVAHPVFFRNDVSAGSSNYAAPLPTSTTAATSAMRSTTTIDPTAAAAWDVEALEDGDNSGRDMDAPGNASISSGRGGREVHSVCPICLGKFEEPVTLTSCLNTFCHTCILGWYEHTVAVALSRGNLSAFHPERGNSNTWRGGSSNNISGSSGTITGNRDGGRKRPAPVPYRCPLCQVPGPFFLAVERPRSSSSPKGKRKANPKSSKPSKLKFRLLGARTVFGGGGPASGGVAVEEHAGGGRGKGGDGGTAGYPSPSMADLRAAVRTQLALAAAAAAAAAVAGRPAGPRPDAEGGSEPSCTGTNEKGVPDGEGMAPETVPGMGMTRGVTDGDRDSSGRPVGSGCSNSSSGSSRQNNKGQSDWSGDRVDSSGGADVMEPPFAAAEPGCQEGGSPMVPTEGGERLSPVPRNRGRDSDWCRSRGRDRKEWDQRTEQQNDDGCSGFRNASSSEVRGEPWHASSSNPPHSCSGHEERKKRKRARKEKEKKRKGATASCRRRNSKSPLYRGETGLSRGGAACGLPWEPGSMAAEDGLKAIETLLEKEKESLRRKMAGGHGPPL